MSHSTTEACEKDGQELSSTGDYAGLMLLLKAIMLGPGYGSDFTMDATLANEFLGLPKQSLAETLAAVVARKSV